MSTYRFFYLALPLLFICGCSKNADPIPELNLENVSSEVVQFEYTPDTGNNTSRVFYEIRFSNPNDVDITGSYTITFEADGVESFRGSTSISPCTQIAANADCSISAEDEYSLELGPPAESVKIVSVNYIIR